MVLEFIVSKQRKPTIRHHVWLQAFGSVATNGL